MIQFRGILTQTDKLHDGHGIIRRCPSQTCEAYLGITARCHWRPRHGNASSHSIDAKRTRLKINSQNGSIENVHRVMKQTVCRVIRV